MHSSQFYIDKDEFIILDKLREMDKKAFIDADLNWYLINEIKPAAQ